eukprot:1339717-Prymnesium_polylepis.1
MGRGRALASGKSCSSYHSMKSDRTDGSRYSTLCTTCESAHAYAGSPAVAQPHSVAAAAAAAAVNTGHSGGGDGTHGGGGVSRRRSRRLAACCAYQSQCCPGSRSAS